jgi:hypothetical protein
MGTNPRQTRETHVPGAGMQWPGREPKAVFLLPGLEVKTSDVWVEGSVWEHLSVEMNLK